MKHLLCLFTLSFFTISLKSQTTFKRNDIYLEAGGAGLFSSVNYERQLTKQPGLGVRLGVGFYTENAFYLTIPVGINYLFELKKKDSFLEAGLGVTWARVDGNLFSDSKNNNADHLVNFMPTFGYRKHTPKNVMWRISATPVVNKFGPVPWIGFAVGKRF